MGLVYHEGKFVPEQNIRKSTAGAEVLRLLRSFLDTNEPELVRVLVNTFRSQGKAITYKELREAILNGTISIDLLNDWMQDYSRFVSKELRPAWEKAMDAAAEELRRKYPDFYFDPMGDGIRSWAESRSGEFVTNVTQTQIEGIRAVVERAAVLDDMGVDELAQAIRPMVGLTEQQAMSNMRYYETLRANGVSQKRAYERSVRYATRQHRKRAYLIARTELATAYNRGAHEATKQAQEEGFLGECIKEWCTANDERVCSVCGSLEGTRWGMDADIMYEYTYKRSGITSVRRINHTLSDPEAGLHPPAHPGCRCGVKYIEIAPPKS